MSAPGIGWVLAFTIAGEIGQIERFAITRQAHRLHRAFARGSTSPATPIAAGRSQSTGRPTCAGRCSRRRCTRFKPPRLRRALPAQQAPARQQRGAKVAQIDVARRLAHAIWHMLTRGQNFAPRGAVFRLAA